MDALWYAITALATYRLTRLVTADQITQNFRGWVADRSKWAGYLVTCDWCFSIWVAPWPTLALLHHGTNPVVQFGLVGLSFSAISGMISLLEQKLDS